MPRNGKSKYYKQVEDNPQVAYNALTPLKKKICWRFWIFLHSNGEKGWDPEDNPGSIFRWREVPEFRSNVIKTSWRQMGISMAKLAKHLKTKGITLKDPNLEALSKQAALEEGTEVSDREKEVSFEDQHDESDNESKKRKAEDSGEENEEKEAEEPSSESESESSQSSSEEEEEEEERKMPSSHQKKKKKAKKELSGAFEETFAAMSIQRTQKDLTHATLVHANVAGNLPVPVLSGSWEGYDHENDESNTFTLMRMCLPLGSTTNDLQLSWVDPTTFKIRLKWPFYMQKVLMMTGLDVDATGTQVYPPNHQVYVDMAKNARALKDDEGQIWAEGLFIFRHPQESHFESKVFMPEVDANHNKALILQVLFMQKREEEKKAGFTSPAAHANATLQFGKISGQNKRSLSPGHESQSKKKKS